MNRGAKAPLLLLCGLLAVGGKRLAVGCNASGRDGTASRHSCIEVGAAPRAALVVFILGWRVAASGGGWRADAGRDAMTSHPHPHNRVTGDGHRGIGHSGVGSSGIGYRESGVGIR